jgi:hypothetical protein
MTGFQLASPAAMNAFMPIGRDGRDCARAVCVTTARPARQRTTAKRMRDAAFYRPTVGFLFGHADGGVAGSGASQRNALEAAGGLMSGGTSTASATISFRGNAELFRR